MHMSGPMTAVGSDLAQHAETVIVEAVSNAVRHSGAAHLTVEVTVADQLIIDIIDNGCGIPPTTSGEAVSPICVVVPSTSAAAARSAHRPRAARGCAGQHHWWISE